MPAVSCRSRALTHRVAALLAVALLGAVLSFVGAQSARAVGNLGLTHFGAIQTDPITGRVFVSGDDKVLVFNGDGSALMTLSGLSGASGMSVDATSLWVVESTGGAITRYDLRTLAWSGRYLTSAPIAGAIASVGGYVWFFSGSDSNRTLSRLDPVSGTISPRGTFSYGGYLTPIPGSETRMLVGNAGISAYSLYLVDVTTNPVTMLARAANGSTSDLEQVAATDRGTFAVASGAPYQFDEFSLTPTDSVLPKTGVVYPGEAYPQGIDYSPANGGLFAATAGWYYDNHLYVYRAGVTTPAFTFDFTYTWFARAGVAIAPDGGHAYVILTDAYNGSPSLVTFPLDPELDSVTPTEVDQPAVLTLQGGGLGSATAVLLDGNAVAFSASDANTLKVSVPTVENGTHDIAVVTPWGTTRAMSFEVLSQPGAPVVSRVSPQIVTTAGGAFVTITGANFVDVRSVRLGDLDLPFQRFGTSTLTLTAPAHQQASVPVVVETDHGTSNTDQLFVWAAPTPSISGVDPATGPIAGGTPVTIYGSGFSYASSVTFDGVDAASFTVIDDHTVSVVTAPHEASTASVVVTTDGGQSAGGHTFRFSSAMPAITSLGPSSGPSPGGTVQINGTGFIGASAVTIGGAGVAFTVASDSLIAATVPPHVPGRVDVVVTTPNGASAAAKYSYEDPKTDGSPRVPTSDLISPPTGAYSFPGDFNGDGVTDVLWYGAGTAPDAMWTFAANGTFTSKSMAMAGSFRPVIGDFTADGVDDIFWYAPGSAADYLQNIKPGGTQTFTRIDVTGTFQTLVGDFTGDGADDIFWYAPGTAADSLWDFNAGGTHTAKALAVTPTYRPVVGDFSGDNVDDIFWYAPGTAADYLQNFKAVAANNTITRIDVNGTFRPFAGDFTGDNVDDIFWYAPGSAADSIWDFNTGGGHATSSIIRSDSAVPSVGDFTGGGVDDVVWSSGVFSAIWFFSPVIR